MSKINSLLDEFCPDGVEYWQLDEIAQVTSSGVDKKTVPREELVSLLNYMDILRHPRIRLANLTAFTSANKTQLKTCDLVRGDILITPTSETIDEIGFACVVEADMPGAVYSYHVQRIRVLNFQRVNPYFLAYLMRSRGIQREITKRAQGITRFGLTLPKWKSLKFPVPPMEIQREIVSILDNFTQLEAELEAELEARRKQYEYYQNQVLSDSAMNSRGARWATLSQVCESISSGGTPKRANPDYFIGNIPWLRTQEVDFDEVWDTELKISPEAIRDSSAKMIPANSVVVAMYGATAGKSAIARIPMTTNQACCNLVADERVLRANYLFHYLKFSYKKLKALGQGTQGNMNAASLKKFLIPIPSIEQQEKIVTILDSFHELVSSPNSGLPAEIKARRQQYEFYRDKLLTFDDLGAA